jgi:1,4-dihydroxy-2-naphthoate octaprenyltransferase
MAAVSKRSAWWLAVRPATLTASAAPVLVGTAAAWADGAFAAGPAVAALLGASLLQIGANFANDVFDFERGADNADRLGPPRATQKGLITPAEMKRAMWLVFAAAAVTGLYLTYVSGWPLLALGLCSIAAAYLYTGGPQPYGYIGLGDLAVFVFFGLGAVVGTYFAQARTIAWLPVVAAVSIGALATAILVVNNLRDIGTDARAGKLTLAVRIGDGPTRVYYFALLAIAYLVPVFLWWRGMAHAWVLLPWLTLPLAFRLAARMRYERGLALNACLVQTARLEAVFGILFALGLAL